MCVRVSACVLRRTERNGSRSVADALPVRQVFFPSFLFCSGRIDLLRMRNRFRVPSVVVVVVSSSAFGEWWCGLSGCRRITHGHSSEKLTSEKCVRLSG